MARQADSRQGSNETKARGCKNAPTKEGETMIEAIFYDIDRNEILTLEACFNFGVWRIDSAIDVPVEKRNLFLVGFV